MMGEFQSAIGRVIFECVGQKIKLTAKTTLGDAAVTAEVWVLKAKNGKWRRADNQTTIRDDASNKIVSYWRGREESLSRFPKDHEKYVWPKGCLRKDEEDVPQAMMAGFLNYLTKDPSALSAVARAELQNRRTVLCSERDYLLLQQRELTSKLRDINKRIKAVDKEMSE